MVTMRPHINVRNRSKVGRLKTPRIDSTSGSAAADTRNMVDSFPRMRFSTHQYGGESACFSITKTAKVEVPKCPVFAITAIETPKTLAGLRAARVYERRILLLGPPPQKSVEYQT